MTFERVQKPVFGKCGHTMSKYILTALVKWKVNSGNKNAYPICHVIK